MISAAEAARVYLAGAGQMPPERLPPSVMVAEIRQLRRLLGQVLAEIDGGEEVIKYACSSAPAGSASASAAVAALACRSAPGCSGCTWVREATAGARALAR